MTECTRVRPREMVFPNLIRQSLIEYSNIRIYGSTTAGAVPPRA